MTTPLFAHPLFSSDFIISFQNLEGSRYVQYVVNYLAITPATTDTQLKDFQKFFPYLISSQVYLPAPKFSIRIIKSGLNNAYGKSKTDFVNMSASHINELLNQYPKIHPKLNLRLIQLKLGKLEFLGVTTHTCKHDSDMETKC